MGHHPAHSRRRKVIDKFVAKEASPVCDVTEMHLLHVSPVKERPFDIDIDGVIADARAGEVASLGGKMHIVATRKYDVIRVVAGDRPVFVDVGRIAPGNA